MATESTLIVWKSRGRGIPMHRRRHRRRKETHRDGIVSKRVLESVKRRQVRPRTSRAIDIIKYQKRQSAGTENHANETLSTVRRSWSTGSKNIIGTFDGCRQKHDTHHSSDTLLCGIPNCGVSTASASLRYGCRHHNKTRRRWLVWMTRP